MDVMRNKESTITERYRALYKLKETEGDEGRVGLEECLELTKSVLLLHEICFALGQRGDVRSGGKLMEILNDSQHDEVTRHEAAEALGAIGAPEYLEELQRIYDENDTPVPVKETIELAVTRINLLRESPSEFDTPSPYTSVDPTPSFKENVPPNFNGDVAEVPAVLEALRKILLDPSESLFDRYRCMFSLRNINTPEAFRIIGEALITDTSSALFRHELAYVLGQVETTECIPSLSESLKREEEHPMVRHESAEALGAVGTEDVMKVIKEYSKHKEPLVSESCQVAIDMTEYWAAWKPTC